MNGAAHSAWQAEIRQARRLLLHGYISGSGTNGLGESSGFKFGKCAVNQAVLRFASEL